MKYQKYEWLGAKIRKCLMKDIQRHAMAKGYDLNHLINLLLFIGMCEERKENPESEIDKFWVKRIS